MKIGVDARPLIGPRTGIANYFSGLLRTLADVDQRHEFILYAPRPLTFQPLNARWRTHVQGGITSRNGVVWLQVYGHRLAERDHIDLFWGPLFLLPLRLNRRIPAIVTVHDLVPVLYPKTMEMRNYLALRMLLRPSLRRAQHVTVDSQSTAGDLHQWLHVPQEKISVIYPGVAADFCQRDPREAKNRVAAAFDLSGPYLLAVATLEPRKNLLTLLRAFASLPVPMRKTWPLVIAGRMGWKSSPTLAAAAPLVREGTVRFLGYVSEADLPWLYAGATLFLFPSVYEGFGLPMAEAMASGIPVIASDIPVAREVAQDAAIFVTPMEVERWAQAIVENLHDERRRAQLREAGQRRAAEFTFGESARRLLGVIERIGRDSPGSRLLRSDDAAVRRRG